MVPSRPLPRGILVALEGIDGTGKSTQVGRLTTLFGAHGYNAVALHEPTHSPWGRRLREAMATGQRFSAPSQELDLFLQDRRYDVAAHIKPALASRKLVLMDRYYFSTMAYQGALGIDPEAIRHMNEAFAPVPDVVCVLLVPPSLALERIRQGRGLADGVFEREGYLKSVDKVFRSLRGPHIHHINADQPTDVVTEILQQLIQAVLGACSRTMPPPPSSGLG